VFFVSSVNEGFVQDDPDEIARVLSLGDPESLAITRHRLIARDDRFSPARSQNT
jgi:hypothetical protein